MMRSSTFQCANLAVLLFSFVGLLSLNGIVDGQLTDPSSVEVGDTIWYVSVRSGRRIVLFFNLTLIVDFSLCYSLSSYEGFVMDHKCIELGTLVDNPTLISLQNPDVHSVHWYVAW
jgi:hypothetical protein